MGFVGAALVICFSRGPWETGWVGWRGGFELRRKKEPQPQQQGGSGDQPGQPGQHGETEGRRDVDVDVEKGAGTGAGEPQRLQSETDIPIDQKGHP